MTRRYYCPGLPSVGGLIELPESEAQHARVMRLAVSDSIELFDGDGSQASATVIEVSRKKLVCTADPAQSVDRESNLNLHLGVALPKPDRAREMIERLTELGVMTLTPLLAARTQRPPGDGLLRKLERGVIEACKQSGRNTLMVVNPPVKADVFFATGFPDQECCIAHPDGSAMEINHRNSPGKRIVFAVGPEGGWSDEEVEMAVQSGFGKVSLGPRILRIETAAAVVAAKLLI